MRYRILEIGRKSNICVAAVLALALNGCVSKPVCEDETTAFVMGNEFIKRELKAPATASFPYVNDPEVSISRAKSKKGKACAFMIFTYVDAENSFGAKIRSRFILTVSPDDESGGQWTLEAIASL